MTPDWLPGVLLFLASACLGIMWYTLSNKLPHHALWAAFGAFTLVGLVVVINFRNDLIRKEAVAAEPVFSGLLTPGSDPGPPLPAHTSPRAVSLLLGDDLRVLVAGFDKYVLSMNGRSFLSIGLLNGKMRISCELMDRKNRLIARIIDNEFQAFPEHAFNPKQPDPHTLVVRDATGSEVLNIRYANPRVMRLVGRFSLPGMTEPVVVSPNEGITWPGGGGVSHMTFDLTEGGRGLLDIGGPGFIRLMP